MKELQPNILDDFEHRIGQLIDHHGDEADFPKMEGTGLTRQDVDDFLFDYQAILDMHGTQKTQLTVYGIIALLPVLAVSAFPDSMLPYPKWALFWSLALGIVIALLIRTVVEMVRQYRLRRMRVEYPDVWAYVDRVREYGDQH